MRYKRERPVRSDKYQYLICEVSCTDEYLSSFDNSHSIQAALNPFGYNEKYDDLMDQLKIRFREIINTSLTERQLEITQLYIDGYTQSEIAKILGCNQSSVTKSLKGNVDYQNGRRQYGGVNKKLKKLCMADPQILEILSKMNGLLEEKF